MQPAPPIGASCTRIKVARPSNRNQNNQASRSSKVMNWGVVDASWATNITGFHPGNNTQPGTSTTGKPAKKKRPTTSEVMDKLNSVMDKFGDLERRLEQQEQWSTSGLTVLSQPVAHSSPKRKSSHRNPVSQVTGPTTRKQLP